MAQKHTTTFLHSRPEDEWGDEKEYTVEFYFSSLLETYDEEVYLDGVHIPNKGMPSDMWDDALKAINKYIKNHQESRWVHEDETY
jgi:hypothetical protein